MAVGLSRALYRRSRRLKSTTVLSKFAPICAGREGMANIAQPCTESIFVVQAFTNEYQVKICGEGPGEKHPTIRDWWKNASCVAVAVFLHPCCARIEHHGTTVCCVT